MRSFTLLHLLTLARARAPSRFCNLDPIHVALPKTYAQDALQEICNRTSAAAFSHFSIYGTLFAELHCKCTHHITVSAIADDSGLQLGSSTAIHSSFNQARHCASD